MPEQRPLKVFLCHARADKPAARNLYRYLRSKGMDPWLDEEKLLAGQNWRLEIPKAISASDVIIICLSKNSVDKEGYVQKEIKFALDRALEMPEGRIFIIPARLEDCDVPESLKNYQWVELFEKNWNRKLMQSLNLRAASLTDVKQAKVTDESNPRLPKIESAKTEQEAPIEKPSTQIELLVEPIGELPRSLEAPLPQEDGAVERSKPARRFDFWIGMISVILVFSLFGILGINYVIDNWPIISSPTPTFRSPTRIVTSTSELATATFISVLPTTAKTTVPPTPMLQITETPSTIPTPDVIEATIDASPRSGKAPLKVYFDARLTVNGVEMCQKTNSCIWDWSWTGMDGNKFWYTFRSKGTYAVAVTICYLTYCDYASVAINVYGK